MRKKTKSFAYALKIRARAAMLLIAMLCVAGGAWAQNELTVYEDGTDRSSYVPFYGLWADTQGCASECVIPSDELTAMTGGTITAIKFYLEESAAEAWTGTHQVYLGEVDGTTLTGITGPDAFTVVATASFDATGTELEITFDDPYTYGGGNLLIGTYVSVGNNYKTAYFYGVNQTEITAWYRGNASSAGSGVKFLPKTTFTYSGGSGVSIEKPQTLEVSSITSSGAVLTWTGGTGTYNVEYKKVADEEWTVVLANTTATTYTFTGLESNTKYQARVQSVSGSDVSGWKSLSFTTAIGFPYIEDFTAGQPATWTCYTGLLEDIMNNSASLASSSGGWSVDTGNGVLDGNHAFANIYSTSCKKWLVTPAIILPANAQIAFDVAYTAYSDTAADPQQTGSDDKFVVLISTDGMATWTILRQWDNAGSTYVLNNLTPAGEDVAISLGDYAGQSVIVAFYCESTVSNADNNIHIDNVAFQETPAFVKPAHLTASEITKNSVQLSWTEKGTATAWVINVYDETNDDSFGEFTTSENPYTLTGLDPETQYTANVRPAGENGMWSDPVHFTTDVAFPAVTDLAAVPAAKSAEISWTGNEEATGYNLRYRVAPLGGTFVTDFEDSSMGEWTTIDADGDGYCWDLTSKMGNFNHHEGSVDCVASASYQEGVGALTPDNYLVSPQVILGGSITFWACAQDASWAGEHFGVAVSTTSNTDPTAFTTIQEWTMTSAGTPASARKKAAGTYGLYTVDLSAYAGQTGYVAIRHFNCTDFFYLNVDDITIEQPIIGDDEPWTVVENATSPYTIEGLTPETKYQVQVKAVYGEGQSLWAETNFTTLDEVNAPSALAASEVTWGTAELSWTENGEATAWEICLNDDEENLIAADSNPFTLTGLTPETEYTAKVRAIKGEKKSKWSNEVTFTTEIRFHAPGDLVASNVTATTAEISWTVDADATGAVFEYASTEGGSLSFDEYKYDNGTFAGTVGMGGDPFQWGVMFPAGSYTGNTLSKVSVYDPTAMTGSVTIYNDGATAPANAVATVPVTFTGVGDFIDIEVNATIDDTKNVWVIFYNESGAGYPAAGSTDDLGDANGRWVEIGGSWYDLANAGVSNRAFMIRAEIGTVDFSSLTWTTVENATSPYKLADLTPETLYAVRVKSVFEEGESKWTSTFFTTPTDNPVPANIVADLAADGATLTWEGNGESYNVQYRTADITTTLFEDDFSDLNQWTVVTNGEGPGWVIGTETGQNAATAYSWQQSAGAYDADNWLISPQVPMGKYLIFYTTTATSYADSYEVLLSTTGNETTDFTVTLQPMQAATVGYVTIDLGEYAGQTGYIAIHHVSNDCYILVVDDLGIYDYVPAGEWQEMAVTENTATISGLATNNGYEYRIQSLKGSKISEWSEGEFALLTFGTDDTDISNLLENNDGRQAHVTLAGRTLFKDGKWNTLTLPFDVDDIEDSPLAGAEAKTLENAVIDEQKVTLNFGNALDNLVAGTPYIIKWNQDDNIEDPEFANVIIENTSAPVSLLSNQVKFIGYYDAFGIDETDTDIYYMGADNKLKQTGIERTLKSCRAYFQLSIAEGAREFILNFGDGEATGISQVESEVNGNDAIYDLQGRRVVNTNKKGLFIQNGKKVVIK